MEWGWDDLSVIMIGILLIYMGICIVYSAYIELALLFLCEKSHLPYISSSIKTEWFFTKTQPPLPIVLLELYRASKSKLAGRPPASRQSAHPPSSIVTWHDRGRSKSEATTTRWRYSILHYTLYPKRFEFAASSFSPSPTNLCISMIFPPDFLAWNFHHSSK